MVKQVKGDLIAMAKAGNFDYIIHGCNCFTAMGGGIAKQIADNFPIAATVDRLTTKGDYNKLGNYTTALVKLKGGFFRDDVFTVINLYTQYTPGPDFNLAALKVGLFKLNKLIPKAAKIGLPHIGAGIGGGDWNKILEVIRVELASHDCTVVEYEQVRR